ncbi:MAG: hypothetical protein H6739_36610 [Alphaproteobacteria bacterium]|nr:hypothetical protein [Alphaproteobacteria bacterium]
MTVKIDISEHRFDDMVDSDNAGLQVHIQRHPTNLILVKLTGLVLHVDNLRDRSILAGLPEYATAASKLLPGECSMEFHDVAYLDITVTLYQSLDDKTFIQKKDGSPVVLSRTWGRPDDGYEYYMGGTLDWPSGDCNIEIRSGGPVILTFEEDTLQIT